MKNIIATGITTLSLLGLAACPNNSEQNEDIRPYWRHPDTNTEALQQFAESLWYYTSQGDWRLVYLAAQASFRATTSADDYIAVKRTCANNLSSTTYTLVNVTVTEDNNPSYGYSTVKSNNGKISIDQEYRFNFDVGAWEFVVPQDEVNMFSAYTADEIVEILIDDKQCFIP